MDLSLSRLRVAAPLVALLAVTTPGCAQNADMRISTHGETRHIEQHNGSRLEVRTSGEVTFNDDADWIVAMSPGARFTVEQETRSIDRRAEFRRGPDGGVEVRFFDRGRERALDAESRAWLQEVIQNVVLESGIGAQTRVRRIRQSSGVDGVLREMGRLRGDVGRRMYYMALLESGPMSSAEFGRVMADVGRRLESDTERRLVLHAAVPHADGDRLIPLLRATEGMDSDTEVRLVLHQVAEEHRLAGQAGEEYLRVAGSVDSDVERRLMLHRFLEDNRLDDATRQAFFRVVEGFDSDTERRLVLHRMLEDDPSEAEVLAVVAAADEIGSDTERRLVLHRVLEGDPSEAEVLAALAAAEDMSSDTERRLVLMTVPAERLRSRRVVDAYRRVVDRMGSDSERSLALRRLAADL